MWALVKQTIQNNAKDSIGHFRQVFSIYMGDYLGNFLGISNVFFLYISYLKGIFLFIKKKSRIRETKNLSTDVDS